MEESLVWFLQTLQDRAKRGKEVRTRGANGTGILAAWREELAFRCEHSSRLSGCVLGDETKEKGTRRTLEKWVYVGVKT